MQCGHKQKAILRLDMIGFLSFQLPVGVINEDENARAAIAQANLLVNEDKFLMSVQSCIEVMIYVDGVQPEQIYGSRPRTCEFMKQAIHFKGKKKLGVE
jgi:hypothetical protein